MRTSMMSLLKIVTVSLLSAAFSIPTSPALAMTDSQEVVTIYFAGTTLRKEMWREDRTPWKDHGELVATLFHNQKSDCQTQHRKFIDGVASDKDKDCTITKAAASIGDCRTWGICLDEAKKYLKDLIASGTGNDLILNIVGFSRGGVLAHWLAHDVEFDGTTDANGQITTVNVLVFDPVSGELLDLNTNSHTLGDRVKQHVGIYARDERTLLFKPTIPHIIDIEEPTIKQLLIQVPGSHETMVGNPEVDGHAGIPLWPDDNINLPIPNSIYNATAMIAVELLSSTEWGGVVFEEKFLEKLYGNNLDENARKVKFIEQTDFDQYHAYSILWRMTSFIPVLRPLEYFNTPDLLCKPYFWWQIPYALASVMPRCIYVPPLTLPLLPPSYPPIPPLLLDSVDLSGEQAWDEIRKMGGYDGDNDNDGIPNNEDNCKDVVNETQADRDGDGIGNACDPCPLDVDNDSDGDGICAYNNLMPAHSDRCPNDFNTGIDADNDGIDEACDDDDSEVYDDGDKEDFLTDNCPYNENIQDEDTDGDGLGDACDPCPEDKDNDSDLDGFCVGNTYQLPMRGAEDLCPDIPTRNPTNINTDGDHANGDLRGDYCDDDDDADEIVDIEDNCPLDFNPKELNSEGILEQPDYDDDGQGDVCDCEDDCDHDGDGWCEDEDCNDDDPSIYPGAIEICGDGIDQDCQRGDALCVALDIKPGSCPNPINTNNKGLLPVAILGDASFSPIDIDPDSVTLFGLSPVMWSWEDVSSPYQPYTGKETCLDCTRTGPDGYLDLTLKFSVPDIVAAMSLEKLKMTLPEDCLSITLNGNLLQEAGGLAIQGEDIMRIRTPAERKKIEKAIAEAPE